MKKLSVMHKVREQLLEVHVQGVYDLDEAASSFADMLAACRFTGLTRVLLDFSDLRGAAEAPEKVLYALRAIEHLATYYAFGGHEVRLAYVQLPSRIGTYGPGLEIAHAFGVDVMLFSDVGRALAWLNAPAPAPKSSVRSQKAPAVDAHR